MKKWSSFSVKSPTEIIHEASHPMNHDRKPAMMSSHSLMIPMDSYCV